MVLGFFELPEETIPPQKYWHSPAHLKEWFESVDQKRKDKAAGFEPVADDEDEDMVDNELAAGLRG